MASSSSDSDVGEKLRNIRSILIKSESSHLEEDNKYSYKRKLGDLVFNANFEAGNLGNVERINKYEYDLMIRPDVANPRSRLWFNFTVANQLPNQCAIFTFVNISENSRLFLEGLTPVVRSKFKPNWTRLHEDQVFYYRSPEHGERYVLSIAFRFSTYENEHQFATFYPYTYTNLVNFISRWCVELKRNKIASSKVVKQFKTAPDESATFHNQSIIKNDQIQARSLVESKDASTRGIQVGEDVLFDARPVSASILSKHIYRLSIKGTSSSMKPKVFILCRAQGNVNSVSSLVCHGLMDYILSNSTLARVARQIIDFECFPMIDPDSCYVGNSQSDLMGQTSLSEGSMRTNKSVYANLITIADTIINDCDQCERVIYLELQVDVNLIGSRVVGTRYKDSLRMERHLSFARLLSRFSNDFYLENCLFQSKSSLHAGLFDLRSRPKVDQYRLDVSPFAHYKRSLTEYKLEEYDQKQYLTLGKAIVYSLLELLQPRDQTTTYRATTILKSFYQRATDIDDLTLRYKDTC